MRQFLVAGFVIALVMSSRADSQLIPLVDASDPFLITNVAVVDGDAGEPIAVVELANQTTIPIDVQDVWLSTARFYTDGERKAAGNRLMWDCARIGHVETPHTQTVAPGSRVITRTPLGPSCQHHRDHEHFFVIVERLQGVHSREPSWKRESNEFVRLLAAAQPHR